jgi:hypothetical protein
MSLRVTVASALACLLAVVCPGLTSLQAAAPRVVLTDVEGRAVDPFLASENSDAVLFLFASVDCPVSNRYAPEVQRLHAAFAPKNVSFWLVYPNPYETAEQVKDHLKAFSYPVHALLDPRHDLVKLARVSITPEAALFDKGRTLAYHGRIDDRFVSLGVERPAATKRDLFDALTAVVAGRHPAVDTAPAVGCFIADFVK